MRPVVTLDGLDGFAALGAYRCWATCGQRWSSNDGAAGWFALPTMSATPVRADLLDPDGGRVDHSGPDRSYNMSRRYLPGMMVLRRTSLRGWTRTGG